MAPIVESIEIERPPQDVFEYVTDPSHLPEWQGSVLGIRRDGTGPASEGTRVVITRRIGRRDIPMTVELADLDPPNQWKVRGVDGRVRGMVVGDVAPVDGGGASRVTLAVDFEGHGLGKLLVPLVVRRQARAEVPENLRKLKELLEGRGEPAGSETPGGA